MKGESRSNGGGIRYSGYNTKAANISGSTVSGFPYASSRGELPRLPEASPVADRMRILPPQLHFLLAFRIFSVRGDSGSPPTVADSPDGFLSCSVSSSPPSCCRRGIRDFSDTQNRSRGSISIGLRVAPFDQEVSIHHMMRATMASEETPTSRRVCRLDV